MKPLTFTALFLALAGLLSCGAKESKGQDSAADAIKNFQTPADAASDAAVEEAAPAGSEAAPASRKKLRISDAWCEHQLWNQAGNNYHPRKMTDGNPATAWAACIRPRLTLPNLRSRAAERLLQEQLIL